MNFAAFKFRELFFDRSKVIGATTAATRNVLSRFGAFVRTTAQRSMPYRKKASKPGSPPFSHKGTLKKLIYFGYDADAHSVVIGPVPINSGKGAPGILEHGGWALMPSKRTVRRIGSGGEIRIGGKASKTTKPLTLWNGKRLRVTYAKLTSGAQVARANALNEQLYGPDKERLIWVEPRPYMEPAKQKEMGVLDSLWRDSIKAA